MAWHRAIAPFIVTTLFAAAAESQAPAAAPAPEFETGGPLAGLKLPPSPRGVKPEWELSPGSVERWRAYMTKYVPVRPYFDRQTQLRHWPAPALPGAEGRPVERFEAPVYQLGRDTTGPAAGERLPPVDVLRANTEGPVFKLDLGELDRGLYVVRLVGAVETAKLRPFREPLYITMKVNDGAGGAATTYRIRCGYVDDFFSIAEIYFHAPEKRRYEATLSVDRGSRVDVLVSDISLDDVLAGAVRRPVKTRRSFFTDDELAAIKAEGAGLKKFANGRRPKPLSPEDRLDRDTAIWNALPPINAQGGFVDMNVPLPGTSPGTDQLTAKEIDEKFGAWTEPRDAIDYNWGQLLTWEKPTQGVLLENKKLGLTYTTADLAAGKPLPDPFPVKDDGPGLFFPDKDDPGKGRVFAPIAEAVRSRLRHASNLQSAAYFAVKTDHPDALRDAAVSLVRYAYQLPAIDNANFLSAVTRQPGHYGREQRCRQRETKAMWMTHYAIYVANLYAYDLLFDYIKGNEDLARSVGRFVPWVKSSRDVTELLDVYLVQHTARRTLRYHDHTDEMAIADIALVMGDPEVTRPWMEWLFDRTFVYPLQPAGIQDLLISGCDREGAQVRGSTFYMQGENAIRPAEVLNRYIDLGGDKRFDLGDPTRYPKPLAACYWQLNTVIGGGDFCRIGDVGGPDKPPGFTLGALERACRRGWRWSNDPVFAWPLANVYGRRAETDADWKAIQAAAATVKRAPWLDLRSRALSNWFVALEAGHEHDDWRFRRAAYVRAGRGIGHEHNDTLDLQVVAHGLPMTIDDGQRSGYSKPVSRMARVHNTVEIQADDADFSGLLTHAWPTTVADAPGARYTEVNTLPAGAMHTLRRQVALIDADGGAGTGSRPLSAAEQKPGAKHPPGVRTPNSYVFDVVRAGGGKAHTYCFHAMVNDEFAWNVPGEKPVAHIDPAQAKAGAKDAEAAYLSPFTQSPESKFAGESPKVLQATWRYSRDGKTGSEQRMAGADFDPASPSKFTRLHLVAPGARALRADSVSIKSPLLYRFTNVYARRGPDQIHRARTDLESVFAAVIEPYAGEPFITSVEPLEVTLPPAAKVAQSTDDPVALRVSLTDGRRDVCFAADPSSRTYEIPAERLSVGAEFAVVSSDARGLRQVLAVGVEQLTTADVVLKTAGAMPCALGRVVAVDYARHTVTVEAPGWPESTEPRVIEIGSQGRMTAYTVSSAKRLPDGRKVELTLTRGADAYRSRIMRVVPAEGRVDCTLDVAPGIIAGSKSVVASNDRGTAFFRADHLGGNDFKLTRTDGRPVAAEDFAPDGVLRLWEYGVGDEVRQTNAVSLRRVGDGTYEVRSDAEVRLSLRGTSIEESPDGKSWERAGGSTDGWASTVLEASPKPVFLRVAPGRAP